MMAAAQSETSPLYQVYDRQSPKSNEHDDLPPPPPVTMPLTHHHVPSSSTAIMIPDVACIDYECPSSPSQEVVINFHDKIHTLHEGEPIDAKLHKNPSILLDESIFDDAFVRSIYFNLTLLMFSVLSCYLWFGHVIGNRTLANAYIIAAFSDILLFNASICGLVLAVFTKFSKTESSTGCATVCVMSLYLAGAFFYFVAACLYAASWNTLGTANNLNLSSFAGIVWTEMVYIAAFALVTGLDLRSQFLDRKDHRIFTMFGIYTFCALLLCISYFVAAEVGIADSDSLTMIGIGWLMGFIVSILYLIYFVLFMYLPEKYMLKITLIQYKSSVDLVTGILLAMAMGWTCVAYWTGEKVRNQDVIYYFGFGLFLCATAVMMAFDVAFWKLIDGKLFGHYDETIGNCDDDDLEDMNGSVSAVQIA